LEIIDLIDKKKKDVEIIYCR